MTLAKFRVWHIPQVPMKAFYVETPSFEEAQRLSKALCDYDLFQFENKIKGDYTNAAGIQMNAGVATEGEWWEVEDQDDVTDIIRQLLFPTLAGESVAG